MLSLSEQVVSKVQIARWTWSFIGTQEQPPCPGRHIDGYACYTQSDTPKSVTDWASYGARMDDRGHVCPCRLFSAERCGTQASAEHSSKQIQDWGFGSASRHFISPPPCHASQDHFPPFVRVSTPTIAVRSKWLPLQSVAQMISGKIITLRHLPLLWKPKEKMFLRDTVRATSRSTCLDIFRSCPYNKKVHYYNGYTFIFASHSRGESSSLWDRVQLPLKMLQTPESHFPRLPCC